MKQLHTFGKVGRDTRFRTVSIVFYAIVDTVTAVKGADDAADARWVNVKDIDTMAFDHLEVLQFALQALSLH